MRSAAEQARLDQLITDLFERQICFNGVIGLKVESLAPEHPRLRFAMAPQLIGNHEFARLHGGVTSTALDAVGGMSTLVGLSAKHPDESVEQVMHRFLRIGTIDLRIDFLRQGHGKWFVAEGRLTRLGGRIASTQMSLHNDEGTLIATGAAAYAVS